MFDVKCAALAAVFLEDYIEHECEDPLPDREYDLALKGLAQSIQDAVENWLDDYRSQQRHERIGNE